MRHGTRVSLIAAALLCAAGAPAAERTVLAIGAHAGDAEITSGAILRGAEAGRRFAVALDVDPIAKKRVLDSLP